MKMLIAGGGADGDIFIGMFAFGMHVIPSWEHAFHGSAYLLMLFAGGEFGYAMTFGGAVTFNVGLTPNDSVTAGYGSAHCWWMYFY